MSERLKTNDGRVLVHWTLDDFMFPDYDLLRGKLTPEEYHNLPQFNISFITEDTINKFCGPCDFLGEDGVCKRSTGQINQTRWVAREWCGWSMVDGKRGQMTSEGFKSSSES